MGVYSEEKGERFHQDMLYTLTNFEGQYNENMMGDVWGLVRESTYEYAKKGYGSPYLPKANKIIRQFQESGLNGFWKETTNHLVMIHSRTAIKDDDSDTLKVLTLSNISIAFYLLGIGLILGLVAFFGEIIIKKI